MKNSKLLLNTILALTVTLAPALSFATSMDIKGCLKQALEKDTPLYQVPEDRDTDGYSRYLVLLCNRDAAKDLYESIQGPPSEGDWNGRTRGTTKFLGENNGASMCYHITRDGNGEKADDYNCSIRLNIDSKQMGKTQSAEMVPFPVK
jgi:hypothetical protein